MAEPDPTQDPPKPEPKPDGGKTLTEAEVRAIAAREKDEGARGARQKVADELGVSLDEAKALIEAGRKAKEAAQSESEKLADERKRLDEERAEAARDRHGARVEIALTRNGITDPTKLERIARLVEVKVGSTHDDIFAAVAKLKEEMPELFTGAAPGPPDSDPTRTKPPAPKSTKDAFSAGEERAKRTMNSEARYAALERRGGREQL